MNIRRLRTQPIKGTPYYRDVTSATMQHRERLCRDRHASRFRRVLCADGYAQENPVHLAHFGYDVIPTAATFAAAEALGIEFATDTAYEMVDCTTLSNRDADVMNTTMALVLACLDDIKVISAFTSTPLALAPEAELLSEAVPGLDISLWGAIRT